MDLRDLSPDSGELWDDEDTNTLPLDLSWTDGRTIRRDELQLVEYTSFDEPDDDPWHIHVGLSTQEGRVIRVNMSKVMQFLLHIFQASERDAMRVVDGKVAMEESDLHFRLGLEDTEQLAAYILALPILRSLLEDYMDTFTAWLREERRVELSANRLARQTLSEMESLLTDTINGAVALQHPVSENN